MEKFSNDLKTWNPLNDPLIKGNAYNTIFIGRLSYEIDEIQLQQKFQTFGKIIRVRIVKDKISNKSKGYAFIEFEKEMNARDAAKEMNGVEINGRKILIDYERGRTSRNWKPRRLGGGLGGRIDMKKKKEKERQMALIQEAKNGRTRGGSRGRGGRGRGGRRDGREREDNQRRYERNTYDRNNYERNNFERNNFERNNFDRNSYRRPEREKSERDEKDRIFEYNSRSRREERITNDRERERERNRRIKENEFKY